MSNTTPNQTQQNNLSKPTDQGKALPVSKPGWFSIEDIQSYPSFLVSLASEDNHWLFISSNGGLTAGRASPARALFPYYTEDKITQLAHTTGPLTGIRWRKPDGDLSTWQPLHPHHPEGSRSLHKKLDGTQICFVEKHPTLPLTFEYTWGLSREYGFIRKATLKYSGDSSLQLDLLDGLQNVNPCGVTEAFQNQFSVLSNAYARGELVSGTSLRLLYLNSIPTDRAEPSESLRANTVWSVGPQPDAMLITNDQWNAFQRGETITAETETRGRSTGALNFHQLTLEPNQALTWYWVAEVTSSTAQAHNLKKTLETKSSEELIQALESSLEANSRNLTAMVASSDGLQWSQDERRNSRHQSNTMFNLMRGGVFLDGYTIPKKAYLQHLNQRNKALAGKVKAQLSAMPDELPYSDLIAFAQESTEVDLYRLTLEYLPLTFSRRHGDPSRPWNRFDIKVRDPQGNRILAYQGNWRDIFQNWEALLYSFPLYTEGVIAKFLNASTADGYNPYRLTDKGFEWEKIDPEEPWSNIGYWGDHQIIYLLRLLEASRKFDPAKLNQLLTKNVFSYACIPYKIQDFATILRNPRESILYDDAMEADIAKRVKTLGADGQLMPDTDGSILHVNLLEKLLVPLLAKLANFVPDGGIWMNTQRPEWNDANNALAGYGLSVVTLAYCHRYMDFLVDWLENVDHLSGIDFSNDVAAWIKSQASVFAEKGAHEVTPEERFSVLQALAKGADQYHESLYTQGLSGSKTSVELRAVLDYLRNARDFVASSLKSNRRADALYHSYNLLESDSDNAITVGRLEEMLEGQVAILSSNLLSTEETLDLLKALRASSLYRPDQDSFLLYPDRDLPLFLQKNAIPEAAIKSSPLLQKLSSEAHPPIIESDDNGTWHFRGDFRNRGELAEAVEALPTDYKSTIEEDNNAMLNAFEALFNHRAFTGRSGTFFAYEGLGSIYWHMVSKLLLAVQEAAIHAKSAEAGSEKLNALYTQYHAILKGLGIHKSARAYGAFPTDAYSHTPKHAGAQQPGMTGQVKEDILVRWGELGLQIKNGTLSFDPFLLNPEEFSTSETNVERIDENGQSSTLTIPAKSLAFTFCHVPIVYRIAGETTVTVTEVNGNLEKRTGNSISPKATQQLFQRNGKIQQIEVTLAG